MSEPDPDRLPFLFALLCCLVVGGAIAIAACGACGGAQRAGAAVIDCTKASQPAIAAVLAEMEPLLHLKSPDWGAVERRAIDAGVTIGGCALVALVTRTEPRQALTVLPAQPSEGQATLERFRERVAGGAMFRTAGGLR